MKVFLVLIVLGLTACESASSPDLIQRRREFIKDCSVKCKALGLESHIDWAYTCQCKLGEGDK